jgi:predicted DNA-binding ribbon-helix-helix protein
MENRRRQDALDLQKRLAEAEIARIDAQTRSLERGDALIRIDGSGLAPELEAFMWKILSAIRARANAEFADYLLGIGVTT